MANLSRSTIPSTGGMNSRTISVDVNRNSRPCCSCLFVFCCLFVSLTIVFILLGVTTWNFDGTADGSNYFMTTLDSFPHEAIDLWPDHHYHYNHNIEERILDLYYDCLPTENSDCLERGTIDSTDVAIVVQKQKIAIIRSPGVLGEVVEQFVTELIRISETDNETIEYTIIKTSHIDPENYRQYTKVIRPAILPFLLEASDLALRGTSSVPDDNLSPNEITIYDIIGIVRQIMRWNIRMSQSIGRDTALYTLAFDRMMAYPAEVENELLKFLRLLPRGGGNGNKKNHQVQMDNLAEKVMLRVDMCNELLLRVIRDYNTNIDVNVNGGTGSPTVLTLVDQAIQEELLLLQHDIDAASNGRSRFSVGSSSTNSLLTRPLRGLPIQRSPVTDLVGYFLDRTADMSEKICQKHPKSFMCLSDTSGQVKLTKYASKK